MIKLKMADIPVENLSRTIRRAAANGVFFGEVQYQPGGLCGPRVQSDFQIVVMEQGEASIEIDGSYLHVPSQHAALMLPGRREYFRFTPNADTHHTWCAVHPSLVSDELSRQLARLPSCQMLSGRLRALIEMGLNAPATEIAAAAGVIEHLGLAALCQYALDAEAARRARSQPDALRAAQAFISDHLFEPLNLRAVAQAAYISPPHLIRLFRQHLGMTPARYWWQLRLERGVELLRETGLPIAEIAQRTGFRNPFHFSRMVKQRYQMSPRALRWRMWNT
ncbi:MAG: helix-turn-helix domain-containing protein [Anaerolineae bacterium]